MTFKGGASRLVSLDEGGIRFHLWGRKFDLTWLITSSSTLQRTTPEKNALLRERFFTYHSTNALFVYEKLTHFISIKRAIIVGI